VIVDVMITLGADFHVDQRVAGQLVEHMVKETNAGFVVIDTGSVEVDLD